MLLPDDDLLSDWLLWRERASERARERVDTTIGWRAGWAGLAAALLGAAADLRQCSGGAERRQQSGSSDSWSAAQRPHRSEPATALRPRGRSGRRAAHLLRISAPPPSPCLLSRILGDASSCSSSGGASPPLPDGFVTVPGSEMDREAAEVAAA